MFSALRLQLLQIGIPATVAEAKYELMLLLRQRGATPDVTAPGVGSPYSPPRQTAQSRMARTRPALPPYEGLIPVA